MQSEVFSGARAIFKLQGQAVGYAVGCSGSTGINYQPLSVLGHLEVVEHVPTAYTVELSANMARIAKATRVNKYDNFPALRADIEGGIGSPQIMAGFGSNGLNILQSGEMQAVIYDIVTKKSLYVISGVKASQKSWDIQAGGMVSESVTFVARLSSEDGEGDNTVGS